MMRVGCAHILLLASLAAAGPAEVPAPVAAAQKTVEQQYGRLIAEARKTPTDADDVALAQQLLIAAGDGAQPEAMQLALIRTAMTLVRPLNSDAAIALMRQAADQAHSIRPTGTLEQAMFERELADKQLARGQAARESADRLKVLGIAAAKAHRTARAC